MEPSSSPVLQHRHVGWMRVVPDRPTAPPRRARPGARRGFEVRQVVKVASTATAIPSHGPMGLPYRRQRPQRPHPRKLRRMRGAGCSGAIDDRGRPVHLHAAAMSQASMLGSTTCWPFNHKAVRGTSWGTPATVSEPMCPQTRKYTAQYEQNASAAPARPKGQCHYLKAASAAAAITVAAAIAHPGRRP